MKRRLHWQSFAVIRLLQRDERNGCHFQVVVIILRHSMLGTPLSLTVIACPVREASKRQAYTDVLRKGLGRLHSTIPD